MKIDPRLIPYVCCVPVVIIAYAAGYVGRDSSSSSRGGSTVTPGAELINKEVIPEGKEGRANTRVSMSAEEVRARTFEVLSVGSRLKRMRALCELLPAINHENWHEVLEGMARLLRTEGRGFNDTPEYHMILEQIGEVAGLEALNEALQWNRPDKHEMISFLLKGMAGRDPKSALDWYHQIAADKQAWLADEIVYAMAKASPESSIEMSIQIPKAGRDALIRAAVNDAMQQKGIREAEHLLEVMRWRSDLPEDVKGSIFLALTDRRMQMNGMDGKPLENLTWAENYVGETFIGPNATRSLITTAALSDPVKTMDWLDRHGAMLTETQAEAAYGAMANIWERQDPAAVSAWIGAHAPNALRDRLASKAALAALGASRTDDAQNLLNTITDPETRAPVEAALTRVQQRQNSPGQGQ